MVSRLLSPPSISEQKRGGRQAMRKDFPGAHVRRASIGLALLFAAPRATPPPHLELPHLETGQPAFAATLGGYSGTPVVAGNRVDILLNGAEIFPAKLAVIRSARRSINYAQYVFEDGKPAEEIAAALAERCRAGVRVNVLLDAVGALAMPGELRTEMAAAGCRVEVFRPLSPFTIDRFNNRNHRRILVVDGVVGVTGGSGISGKWSGNGKQRGHWRDTDVRIEGPVVEQLQGAFAENWLEATGVAIGGPVYFPRRRLDSKGDIDAQIVRSSPAGRGGGARGTVLLRAPAHHVARAASRSGFGRLLKGGVLIYEYKPALLHAKTMVIDGIWATVGS